MARSVASARVVASIMTILNTEAATPRLSTLKPTLKLDGPIGEHGPHILCLDGHHGLVVGQVEESEQASS